MFDIFKKRFNKIRKGTRIERVLSTLNSYQVSKDIEYIIDKLSDWEDRGHIASIHIMCYDTLIYKGDEWYTNEHLVEFVYCTLVGFDSMKICDVLKYYNTNYQKGVFKKCYDMIKKGQLCYYINFNTLPKDTGITFGKMEILKDYHNGCLVLKARL